jgi:hypothetical protein
MELSVMMRIRLVKIVEQLVIESMIVLNKRIGVLELFVVFVVGLDIWLGELCFPS